ncbi:MAG: 50S ribosomal protein L9 [Bacteroidetes bacterium 4572_112]|nr:MAG: 50S ribosomal protein L9 [Bacteroidetes bacterium 4572_112]
MKVILKQDIAKLGFINDTIVVKDGYARNYLIPQGIAIQATSQNEKILAEVLKQKAHKEEKIRTEAQTLATSIEAVKLTIGAKVGTSGQIFGSVNAMQIADALKAQANIELDRKKIVVNSDKIKEVGEFTVIVNLHRDVKATITVEVVAE